jgi:hypothetical protein
VVLQALLGALAVVAAVVEAACSRTGAVLLGGVVGTSHAGLVAVGKNHKRLGSQGSLGSREHVQALAHRSHVGEVVADRYYS